MFCVWQVVKTPTIILNNPVYSYWLLLLLLLLHELSWYINLQTDRPPGRHSAGKINDHTVETRDTSNKIISLFLSEHNSCVGYWYLTGALWPWLKFLYKLMDLAWLAKVILIEDIRLCFNTYNKTICLLRQKHNNSIWYLYITMTTVIYQYHILFHCLTVHFNSLNLIHQQIHFYIQ